MTALLEIIERGELLGLRGAKLRTWFESDCAQREAERVMELEREREEFQAELEKERQLRSARAAQRSVERVRMEKDLQELELQLGSLEAKKASGLVDRRVHVKGSSENAVETHSASSDAFRPTFCYESGARTLSRRSDGFLSDTKVRVYHSHEELNATPFLDARCDLKAQVTSAVESEAVRALSTCLQ